VSITSLKLGLIAGNGRFPFLLLDAARAHGLDVVVAAIKEETFPEIDERAAREPEHVRVHWMSLGELSRLIETFQREGVTRAVMAGQVKHKQIFSSIRPDWRLAKLLLNLRTRNTDMLLGAVAKVLGDEGIELISSTEFLEPMLAAEGVLTQRFPDEMERRDILYGLTVARGIAGFDLGQTVVIAAGACVAVEAMEGTDATIGRAGELFRSLEDSASTLERRLTVVKVAKPNQDMRFDVPVVGLPTIEAMRAAGATCLCVEAGRTLLFDREAMVAAADEAGIAIVAEPRASDNPMTTAA
jgi:UDP-2,3-diacylglucosamine hydrolase